MTNTLAEKKEERTSPKKRNNVASQLLRKERQPGLVTYNKPRAKPSKSHIGKD
jgi:hypothetical protein